MALIFPIVPEIGRVIPGSGGIRKLRRMRLRNISTKLSRARTCIWCNKHYTELNNRGFQ